VTPYLDLALIAALLVLSAFFSGSEVGFLSVGLTRARQLSDAGGRTPRLLLLLKRHRSLALSTILLGITATNYTAERLAVSVAVQWHPVWGPVGAAVVMTAIILIFCEVLPIQRSARDPERTALRAAVPVAFLSFALAPLVFLLSILSRLLLRIGGLHAQTVLPAVTQEHLMAMIEQSQEQGELAPSERRMLRGVLEFGDYTVAQIMTPRADMVCVEAEQSLQEALELGLEHRHSRLPIFRQTPDDITGVLHLKDLLPFAFRADLDQPVATLARPACHVPGSLPADSLLQQLQREHITLAIVRDEYGGTAGVVTVEDLLEEIVGEIRDEYDEEEPEVVQVGPREYLCSARVSLHDLQDYLTAAELPTDDYESLGGLLLDIAGHIPVVEERLEYAGLAFVVEQMNGPRVERIRVIEHAPGDLP
jgi:CBS domain containing-hemolysin-like protein